MFGSLFEAVVVLYGVAFVVYFVGMLVALVRLGRLDRSTRRGRPILHIVAMSTLAFGWPTGRAVVRDVASGRRDPSSLVNSRTRPVLVIILVVWLPIAALTLVPFENWHGTAWSVAIDHGLGVLLVGLPCLTWWRDRGRAALPDPSRAPPT